ARRRPARGATSGKLSLDRRLEPWTRHISFRTFSRCRPPVRRSRARRIVMAMAGTSPIAPGARSWGHDRAVGCYALRRGGHRDRGRVPRVRRHARAAGACSGDAGRADYALSRHRRALALRAHPLAEILPMTRSHRSVHRALWPILALAVALGL